MIAVIVIALLLAVVLDQAVIGVLGSVIGVLAAGWLFYLRRQNDLSDEAQRQDRHRRATYTVIVANLRQYRDQISYLSDYITGIQLLENEAALVNLAMLTQGLRAGNRLNAANMKAQMIRGLAPHLEAINWPENLILTANDARHLDADHLAALQHLRTSTTNYQRQINAAAEDRGRPLLGFAGELVKRILEDLDAIILHMNPTTQEADASVHGAPLHHKPSS